jgi:hypothetical protein
MPREKELEVKVVRFARELGLLVYKFSSPSNRGVPDRLFVNEHGTIGFLELKAKGEKPTKLQMFHLDLFRARGVPAGWVDTFEAAKTWLQDFRGISK